MEEKEINLIWMYPDMLNLHGDRGNIMAFEKVGKILGVKINIIKIENYEQEINFDKADIIFFNPGELKVIPSIISALKKQTQALEKYIEDNKIIVLVGTTGALMSKEIQRKTGEVIEGLGYLDMKCIEKEMVEGNDIVINLNEDSNLEIGGCQIQIIDTVLNKDIALGKVSYGIGNNKTGDEGAKYKNVIFTNILGPVLVKNPWYVEKLIRQALENKGLDLEGSIECDYELEYDSLRLLNSFIDKKRG